MSQQEMSYLRQRKGHQCTDHDDEVEDVPQVSEVGPVLQNQALVHHLQKEDTDSHLSAQQVQVAGALSSGLPTAKPPRTSCPRPTLHGDPKSRRTGPTGSLHIRCEARGPFSQPPAFS